MQAKTMEGLVGARTNIEVMQTPMRVYKDARRRGDMAVMERSMDYAGDFAEKAAQYKETAAEGMEEDAKEAKKQAEAVREKSREARRTQREEQMEHLEKIRDNAKTGGEDAAGTGEIGEVTDEVEISAEGRALLDASQTAGLTKEE